MHAQNSPHIIHTPTGYPRLSAVSVQKQQPACGTACRRGAELRRSLGAFGGASLVAPLWGAIAELHSRAAFRQRSRLSEAAQAVAVSAAGSMAVPAEGDGMYQPRLPGLGRPATEDELQAEYRPSSNSAARATARAAAKCTAKAATAVAARVVAQCAAQSAARSEGERAARKAPQSTARIAAHSAAKYAAEIAASADARASASTAARKFARRKARFDKGSTSRAAAEGAVQSLARVTAEGIKRTGARANRKQAAASALEPALHPATAVELVADTCRLSGLRVMSPSDVDRKRLSLPAEFSWQAELGNGPMQLVTQHGSWLGSASGEPGRQRILGGSAAVISALQLSAGDAFCLTVLGPGRLLITTEGEPQFSAAVAEAARVAASSAARLAAESAVNAAEQLSARAALQPVEKISAAAPLPPLVEGNVEADTTGGLALQEDEYVTENKRARDAERLRIADQQRAIAALKQPKQAAAAKQNQAAIAKLDEAAMQKLLQARRLVATAEVAIATMELQVAALKSNPAALGEARSVSRNAHRMLRSARERVAAMEQAATPPFERVRLLMDTILAEMYSGAIE